ncbi:hypothetical protein ACK38U_01900 [Aeromonas veronii]
MADYQGTNVVQPTVEHARSSTYQVHVVSGGAISPMDGRIEVSFFADRVRYLREGLSAQPDNPTLMRANGQIEATPLREHVAGVNMSLEGLIAFRDLINSVIADLSNPQNPLN